MGLISELKKKLELQKKRNDVKKRFNLTSKGLKEFEAMAGFLYENTGVNLLNMEIVDLTGEYEKYGEYSEEDVQAEDEEED
jgi:hypothetical protein